MKQWLKLEDEKRRDAIMASTARRQKTGGLTIANARTKKTEKAIERAKALQLDIDTRMAAGKARPVAIRVAAKEKGVKPATIRKTLRKLTQKNVTD